MDEQVTRIMHMEEALDILLEYNQTRQGDIASVVEELKEYYTSELWILDMQEDQNGTFQHIKRGVLSEDGIQNALEAYYEVESQC